MSQWQRPPSRFVERQPTEPTVRRPTLTTWASTPSQSTSEGRRLLGQLLYTLEELPVPTDAADAASIHENILRSVMLARRERSSLPMN